MKSPLKTSDTTRNVTINDVAAAMGVAKSTVSRALNDHPEISPTMRDAVLKQAREMGFQASAVARSLSRRRSNTIGVWSGDYFNTRSAYIAEVISGLQGACDEYRLDLLLHGTFPGRSVDEISAEFHSGKIDGLIALNLSPEIVKHLARARIPVVALVDEVAELPCVIADEVATGELMARFLLDRGHRHFWFRKRHDSASSSTRNTSFCHTVQSAGARCDEELVPVTGVTEHERKLFLNTADEPRPSAVVGWEDDAAYEMLDFCRRTGLHVPQDVTVVGLNGVDRLGSGPRLTTVVAPYAEIAQKGVELILQLLRGEAVAPVTTFPVVIREGETA